jgi:hypothetical protein
MHVEPMGKGMSLDARGTFGYSGAFGRIAFGFNRFGFYHWYCGIYQKKYYFGKPYISKEKFYRPTNPQTERQMLWRGVVTSGHNEWASFDIETKEQYRLRARGLPMTGYNLFMREWLNSHKYVLA